MENDANGAQDEGGGNGRDSFGRFLPGHTHGWQPGQSGDPGGGPAWRKQLLRILNEQIERTYKGEVVTMTRGEELARAIWDDAIGGGDQMAIAMRRLINEALTETAKRTDGGRIAPTVQVFDQRQQVFVDGVARREADGLGGIDAVLEELKAIPVESLLIADEPG